MAKLFWIFCDKRVFVFWLCNFITCQKHSALCKKSAWTRTGLLTCGEFSYFVIKQIKYRMSFVIRYFIRAWQDSLCLFACRKRWLNVTFSVWLYINCWIITIANRGSDLLVVRRTCHKKKNPFKVLFKIRAWQDSNSRPFGS